MKKVLYFIVQLIISLLISSLNWYLFSMSIRYTEGTIDVNATPAILFLSGLAVLLIFTVVYIIIGWKKVEEWRWWCILISAAINIASVIVGYWGATALVYVMFYSNFL